MIKRLENDHQKKSDHSSSVYNRLNLVDKAIDYIGSFFSWFWLLTVGVIITSVISRYVFSKGSVMLEEIQWHLAASAWLIGLSFTFVHNAHVRVDVLHERFSSRTKAWLEVLGITFLFIPFVCITLWEIIPYAYSSFQQNERSQAPNGLPFRWMLKSLMPLAMFLLLIAGSSRLYKAILSIAQNNYKKNGLG